jgi:hypothetical protein
MNKLIKSFIAIIFSLFIYHSTVAQNFKKEKRIYLFDLTASMKGQNGTPDIFEDVKNNFAAAIDKLDNDDTEIVILTFTNKVIDRHTFKASEKQKIKKTINDFKIEKGNTDITTAWAAGSKELDPKKVNYMFLLTDGRQTVGGSTAEQSLYSSIRNWKTKAGNNDYYAFYVMLTKNATSDVLANNFKESSSVWPVESMDIDFKFIQPSRLIYYNIKDDAKKKVPVFLKRQLPQNFSFNIQMPDNPYYKLNESNYTIKDGAFVLKLILLQNVDEIPQQFESDLYIKKNSSEHWDVFFTPESIKLKMINKKEKVLTIYQKQNAN